MPEYWYRISPNMPREGDSDEELKTKEFNLRIAAAKKPLFMIYVYPKLKKEYKDYIKSANQKLTMMYGALGINSIDDLRCYEPKTEEMKSFIYYYDELMPVGVNDCIVNRIARIFDREFEKIPTLKGEQPKFDTSILKSGAPYSTHRYRLMSSLYTDFLGRTQEYEKRCSKERLSKAERWWERHRIVEYFKSQAYVICANKDELCDILVDMCYKAKTSKTFVWDMCEEELIAHLLDCNDGKIIFPQHVEEDGEFEYAGEQFVMKECEFPGFSRIRKVSWQ